MTLDPFLCASGIVEVESVPPEAFERLVALATAFLAAGGRLTWAEWSAASDVTRAAFLAAAGATGAGSRPAPAKAPDVQETLTASCAGAAERIDAGGVG